MPSVDRAGRYFPLTVATPCGAQAMPIDCLAAAADWYSTIEAVMLQTLEDDELTLDALDAELATLSLDLSFVQVPPDLNAKDMGVARSICSRVEPSSNPERMFAHVLNQLICARIGFRGFWWTSGGAHIKPTMAVFQGLLPSDQFDGLLTGDLGRLGVSGPESWFSRSVGLKLFSLSKAKGKRG
jgi:type VI secretion system protein ImpM